MPSVRRVSALLPGDPVDVSRSGPRRRPGAKQLSRLTRPEALSRCRACGARQPHRGAPVLAATGALRRLAHLPAIASIPRRLEPQPRRAAPQLLPIDLCRGSAGRPPGPHHQISHERCIRTAALTPAAPTPPVPQPPLPVAQQARPQCPARSSPRPARTGCSPPPA